MKRLQSMISFFEKITAGILFVTAIYIPVFYGWDLVIYADILWQILLLSAVCTLGSILMPLEGEKEMLQKELSQLEAAQQQRAGGC